MTRAPDEQESTPHGPHRALAVLYILVVLTSTAVAVASVVLGKVTQAGLITASVVVLAPVTALLGWPWPRYRLDMYHLARGISSIVVGFALFQVPILLDHGDAAAGTNVGLLEIALVSHGAIVLLAGHGIRRNTEREQEALAQTCRQVLVRVESLQTKLEQRDQAVAAEVQTVAAAVERLARPDHRQRRGLSRLWARH